MQDRPTIAELLEAVRDFLERDVVDALEGTTKFHARVAVNVLGIAPGYAISGEPGRRNQTPPAVAAPIAVPKNWLTREPEPDVASGV